MQVTDVRIRVIDRDSKMKAIASVTFDDCFVVHDIKVIEGEKGYFIAMPSKRTPDEQFRDVAHPINPQMREELEDAILARFREALQKQKIEFRRVSDVIRNQIRLVMAAAAAVTGFFVTQAFLQNPCR